ADKMRRDLAIDELGDLLERPLVAILATYRANGEALLSPVWHEWRDGGFTVVVGVDDAKARQLRRDPRAGLVVFDHEPPYRGVELRGRARFVEEGVVEAQRRIARRYLGQERGTDYADSVDFDEVIVRLEPGIVRAWDFSDEYGLSG
ncbi:MAG: TIGR03618 family F420-dependent PPOX class oxidoreductase, partial [Actinomycetota bacterium]